MNRAVQHILLLIIATTALGGLQRSAPHHHHGHDHKNSTIASPSLNETVPSHDESTTTEEDSKVTTAAVIKKVLQFVEEEVAEINRLRNDPFFKHEYMPSITGVLLGITAFLALLCLKRCCCRRRDRRYRVHKLGRGSQRNRVHDEFDMLLPRTRFDEDSDNH